MSKKNNYDDGCINSSVYYPFLGHGSDAFVTDFQEIKVNLRWSRYKKMWMLMDNKNKFIQELFDCSNVHKYFPGLNKKKKNRYTMYIAKG